MLNVLYCEHMYVSFHINWFCVVCSEKLLLLQYIMASFAIPEGKYQRPITSARNVLITSQQNHFLHLTNVEWYIFIITRLYVLLSFLLQDILLYRMFPARSYIIPHPPNHHQSAESHW